MSSSKWDKYAVEDTTSKWDKYAEDVPTVELSRPEVLKTQELEQPKYKYYEPLPTESLNGDKMSPVERSLVLGTVKRLQSNPNLAFNEKALDAYYGNLKGSGIDVDKLKQRVSDEYNYQKSNLLQVAQAPLKALEHGVSELKEVDITPQGLATDFAENIGDGQGVAGAAASTVTKPIAKAVGGALGVAGGLVPEGQAFVTTMEGINKLSPESAEALNKVLMPVSGNIPQDSPEWAQNLAIIGDVVIQGAAASLFFKGGKKIKAEDLTPEQIRVAAEEIKDLSPEQVNRVYEAPKNIKVAALRKAKLENDLGKLSEDSPAREPIQNELSKVSEEIDTEYTKHGEEESLNVQEEVAKDLARETRDKLIEEREVVSENSRGAIDEIIGDLEKRYPELKIKEEAPIDKSEAEIIQPETKIEPLSETDKQKISPETEIIETGVSGSALKDVEKYSEPQRYNSEIEVGQKYYDNRYGDFYTIEKMTPVEGGDVDVTLKYDKGKIRTESGNFLLYHIDAKQHSLSKEQPIVAETSKQEKTNDYYIYDFDNKEFVKVENAKSVKLDTEGDFFAVKGDNGYYTIYEGTSGQGIGQSGKLLRDAIKNANESIERNSKAGFPLEMAISGGIKRNGQSPRVAKAPPQYTEAATPREGVEGVSGSALKDVEAKKADIERRRQEELDRLLKQDTERFWNTAFKHTLEEFINLVKEKFNNNESANKQAESRWRVSNQIIKKQFDKINAKYDAELKELNANQEVKPKTENNEKESSVVSGSALKDVESTAKALEDSDFKTNTPIKGLSVRMSDLRIAEDNLSKGKKSITPNEPIDVTINLTTGNRELSDGYHRYLDARGGTIEKAKTRNLEGSLPAKIKFEINEKSSGFVKTREATNKEISEAYHKAKKDGSNPELVKAVEEALSKPNTNVTTPTKEVSTSENKIKSWIDKWEELKKENDNEQLDLFYNKVKVALNGYAQGKGVVDEFTKLKSEIEQFAKERKAKTKEQGNKERVSSNSNEGNSALKDVESTAKALKEAKYDDNKLPFSLDYLPQDHRAISEAYHKAKSDGTNPELVKAVEDLLGKAPTQYTEAAGVSGSALKDVVSYEDAIKITPTSELTNPEKYGTDELGMEAKTAALRDEEKTPPKFTDYKVGTYAKDRFGDLYQLQNVPIDKIVLPEGEQKREATVEKYKKWYNEGSKFPPAKGVENYAVYDGKIVINDGHHRVIAAKQLGLKEVPVWVSLTDPKNPARPITDIEYHKSLTKAPPQYTEAAGVSGSALKDVDFTAKGGNKIVDEKGEPITLLHGTNNDKIKFDEGTVFYATSDKQFADVYGENHLPVQISLKNPYDLTESADGVIKDRNGEPMLDSEGKPYSINYIDQSVVKDLKERGYDGVRMGNESVVAFDKSQVKAPTQYTEAAGSSALKDGGQENVLAEQGKKSLANRVYEGNTPEEIKASVEKNGLTYDIEKQDVAEQNAIAFMEEVGTDNALKAVRNGEVSNAAETFIFGKAIDDVYKEGLLETDPARKQELLTKEAELIKELDERLRSKGRAISAANAVYQTSDLGYKLGSIINRAVEANQGELPKEVVDKLTDLSAKLDEANRKLEELKRSKKDPDLIIKEPVKRQSLSPEKLTRKLELRKKYSGVFNDVTNIPRLIAEKEFREYAGLVLEEMAGDFKAFSTEMINTVGKGIREHLPKLYKDLGGKENPEMARISAGLKKSIAEYERKLKEKDFASKKRGKPELDAETFDLLVERNKLKDKVDLEIEKLKLKNRTTTQKLKDGFVDVLNLPKSLIASADMSAPLRQGAILSFKNPKIAAKSAVEMFRQAFSEDKAVDWLTRLKSSPEYARMKDAGLYFAEPTAKLSAKEEQFISNIAHKIPIWGRVVKGSERAYSGYLNKLRADVFTAFEDALVSEGFKGEQLDTELKSFADFVNNATGRGSLGRFEESTAVLNAAFFSPRYAISRFNLLSPVKYAKMSPRARAEALKSVGTYIGLGSIVLALAKAGGAEVGTDFRSADAGKIKVGDTRFDIWAGFQQWVRLITQVAKGEKVTIGGKTIDLSKEGYGKDSRLDVLGRFARSKASPTAGLLMDVLDGEDMLGNPVTFKFNDLESFAKSKEGQLIIPLYLQDIKKTIDSENKGVAAASIPASFFGVGVQTYSAEEPKTPWEISNKFKGDKEKITQALIDNIKEEKKVQAIDEDGKGKRDAESGKQVMVELTPAQTQALKEAETQAIKDVMERYDSEWTNEEFESEISKEKSLKKKEYLESVNLR